MNMGSNLLRMMAAKAIKSGMAPTFSNRPTARAPISGTEDMVSLANRKPTTNTITIRAIVAPNPIAVTPEIVVVTVVVIKMIFAQANQFVN
jgi:hypothetical protein